MLLSVVSVLVVAQSSSEIPEGLMNNPVYSFRKNSRQATVERQTRNEIINQDTINKSNCNLETLSLPQYMVQ